MLSIKGEKKMRIKVINPYTGESFLGETSRNKFQFHIVLYNRIGDNYRESYDCDSKIMIITLSSTVLETERDFKIMYSWFTDFHKIVPQ